MWFSPPYNKTHQITAAVILGILFVVIFLMMNQIPMSPSSSAIKDKAFQISFSLLLSGPFVVLYQRLLYSRFGAAVTLWGVYGLSALALFILANNASGSTPLMLLGLFLAFSGVVFVSSFLLLALKPPNDKPRWLTLLAISISMFCSGMVLLEFIFFPIVI